MQRFNENVTEQKKIIEIEMFVFNVHLFVGNELLIKTSFDLISNFIQRKMSIVNDISSLILLQKDFFYKHSKIFFVFPRHNKCYYMDCLPE